MAFQFPDPNVTPEFEGDNGITYVWDATDGKWAIKGFSADLDDRYVNREGGDSMEGPLELTGVDGNLKFGTAGSKIVSSSDTELAVINSSGIFYDGNISSERHLVNKKYVDDIAVELEEEIDAIAPSVERGIWTFNLGGLAGNRGQLALYDDNYNNVGNPTGLLKNARSIWLNEEDNAGTPHGFANVGAGEFIELFVQGQPEYGLYEVVDVHDETSGASSWWVIEVNFVRTLEDTSTADNGDLIRVKIFQAPTGGDVSSFLNKYGDNIGDATASINYEWNKQLNLESLEGIRLNAGSSSTIASSTEGSTYTTAIFYVEGDRNGTPSTKFRVRANGKVQAGHDAAEAFIATEDHDLTTKKFVDAEIATLEAKIPDPAQSGRVIITPLEFKMNAYSQYPSNNGITGLTAGGNPTSSNDVYGYHIPWLWFENNHPELIGFIFTEKGNLIDGREASLYERDLSGRPGLEIRDSSNSSRYATVTIQGWHVVVDDISEDQYTHKFP